MEKPLYGFVTYPQGVTHVTLAFRNSSDLSKGFNLDTIDAFAHAIGTIVKRYATGCKLPQRICTDSQKGFVFTFDGFAEDKFGNVRAYYKFAIDTEMNKDDGTATLQNSPTPNKMPNGTTE
jgi:hypothetical protein